METICVLRRYRYKKKIYICKKTSLLEPKIEMEKSKQVCSYFLTMPFCCSLIGDFHTTTAVLFIPSLVGTKWNASKIS